MKIGVTIFVLFVGFMVIGCSAAIHSFYLGSEDTLKEQVYAHLETTAQSRANHIETELDMEKEFAENLALIGKVERLLLASENDADYNDKKTAVEERLQKTTDSIDQIVHVSVTDKSGKIIASTNPVVINQDKSTEEYFLTAKQKTTTIGKIHFTPGNSKPVFVVAAPVIVNNEVLGVVLMIVDLEKSLFYITLDKTGLGETGEIYLINKDGYMITPSRFIPEKATFLEQKVDTENSRNCLMEDMDIIEHMGHEPVTVFEDYRGENVLGTHVYIPETGWCLLAELDETEALSELKIQLFKSAIFSLIIMVFFIFLAEYFIRGIVKQIYARRDRK
jgi:hypothetical protein